ncbi:uncharacterized protein KIAA0825 homolog isoform X2 [Mixophyes fleayi]|uniref:uncharacterized protein KIAA0825 homolog isoform X2 n=1 Tax=Mixophyes fleayi TaxID=3061075 RepID=UPI003F4E0D3C
MDCAGEDQLSFALLDCVLEMFPGQTECQQILNDIDEKLKKNSMCIEECLENLRQEVNDGCAGEILQNNVDCLQWLNHPTTSRRLSDTPHSDVMVFLKTVQHFLKNCENQEDTVLQFLMDISSECGIIFPSIPSGSSFHCTSQTSLHTIEDDSSMDLQAVWDNIRLHLRRYLVGKLQVRFDTYNNRSNIHIKAQCLQHLLFLYPESDVLAKYQNIQQNFIVELLHNSSGSHIGSVLGAYQEAIPKVYMMIKEDLFVLSRVIDSSLIIKFCNETFFEAITEEMKTFFEILQESNNEEQPIQPACLNKKKHKQKVHALARNNEDHQRKTSNTPLHLNQLKSLSTFIKLFLWLDEKVENATSEILFLSSYPEIKGNIQGIIKDFSDGKTNESCILDESSLLMKETPTLKFDWRNNLKDLSRFLLTGLPGEMEAVTTYILQRDSEEFSITGGSRMSLVHISGSYEHYGSISEKQRPKKVAKFCFDITEEFDGLFPLALACRDDSLQNIRTCFIEAFSNAVTSVLTRLEEWSSQVPDNAPVQTALVVTSSAIHILHHLAHYNEQMSKRPLFLAAVQRYQEFISNLQIQVTNYCVNICAISLFQDAESHHWDDNNAFYEGERCSFSIQMWNYFCCGLRYDLWTVVPPADAQKILSEVLEQTLALLTFRYSQVHPNYKRTSQIRIDVLAILSCVENLLWSVCSTSQELVSPTQNPTDMICKIHNHCNHLMTILTALTAPLEILMQAIKNNAATFHGHSSEAAPQDLLYWLTFINPSMFPSSSKTPSAGEMAVQGQLKLLLSQPCCNWNLLLETLLHPDCLIARTLLTCSITEVLETSDSEILVMEANNIKDLNLTEMILSVFCCCTLSPQFFTTLLEKYMDQELLWDSLCNQTAYTSRNVVLRYLRRTLVRSVQGMVNQITSFISSIEPTDDCLSFSHHHNTPDVLLKSLPEKWNFTTSGGKESKKHLKNITRLTAEAVSIVISKIPSIIACLPPPIKYFYLFSEKKISEQYSVCKDTGILVWNLIGIICHILEDGKAIEQMIGTTLSPWSKEKLAVVCRCLEKSIGIKSSNPKEETQRVFEDIEKHQPKWIEKQVLKAKVLSSEGGFEMQEDSSILKDQGSRLDLTEQKINMMVLDICHKPGGSEYLRQIHHIIQLNEDYLKMALSSQHSEQQDTNSRAFQLTLTNVDDSFSSFNPLHIFKLPGLNVLTEATSVEESWDWLKLLPHCLEVNPVTLGGLLLHRWETKDEGSLTEEERNLMEHLKEIIFSGDQSSTSP